MICLMPQREEALVIAENVDMSDYSPYGWAAFFAVLGCAFAKCIKDKRYFLAGLLGLVAADQAPVWYQEWAKTQKPAFSVQEYVDAFKVYPPQQVLSLYACTPLFALVKKCDQRGIQAIDLEFRYHMLGASFEENRKKVPFLIQTIYYYKQAQLWLARKITGNKVRYTVTLGDYCDVNDTVLLEISTYSKDPILQAFFEQCISNYESSYITQELRARASVDRNISLSTIIPRFGYEI